MVIILGNSLSNKKESCMNCIHFNAGIKICFFSGKDITFPRGFLCDGWKQKEKGESAKELYKKILDLLEIYQ
jgi:hypothetical protein